MDISGRVLREVEFRDRLRGYDTEEVDEFLEKVAVAVDDLLTQLDAAKEASARAEESPDIDESLRRTLVLAQRTADLAIKEARDEASAMLEDARAQAEELVGSARQESSTLRAEAQTRAKETIADLEERKTQLETEVAETTNFIEALRKQLVFALQGALETVGESLKPPAPMSSSVRKRLGSVAKNGDEDEKPSRTDDLAGPPTEGVAAADGEEAEENGEPETEEKLALVEVKEEDRESEKARHSRRDEKSSARDAKAGEAEKEPDEDLEAFSITGEEAIVSVESVVDPDEELWQRWAKGADLDTDAVPQVRPRSLRSTGRTQRSEGGFSA
ncbi:MAG: DivIVA domain-containing protein [Acidimicrobiales bacterium]